MEGMFACWRFMGREAKYAIKKRGWKLVGREQWIVNVEANIKQVINS